MISGNEQLLTTCFFIWYAWIVARDTDWWKRNVRGERDE